MSAAEKALSAPALGVGYVAGLSVRLGRGLVYGLVTLPMLAFGWLMGMLARAGRLMVAAFVEGYRAGAGIDG